MSLSDISGGSKVMNLQIRFLIHDLHLLLSVLRSSYTSNLYRTSNNPLRLENNHISWMKGTQEKEGKTLTLDLPNKKVLVDREGSSWIPTFRLFSLPIILFSKFLSPSPSLARSSFLLVHPNVTDLGHKIEGLPPLPSLFGGRRRAAQKKRRKGRREREEPLSPSLSFLSPPPKKEGRPLPPFEVGQRKTKPPSSSPPLSPPPPPPSLSPRCRLCSKGCCCCCFSTLVQWPAPLLWAWAGGR